MLHLVTFSIHYWRVVATTLIVFRFQIAFGQSERQRAIVKHIRPKIGQKREGGEKVVEGKGGDGGRMRRKSWPGDQQQTKY